MDSSQSMSSEQRQKVMEQVAMQVELAKLKQIMQSVQEKCFKMCVPKPSTSLSNGEQKCLGQCMDRYIDALQLVEKSYVSRLQQEGGGGF